MEEKVVVIEEYNESNHESREQEKNNLKTSEPGSLITEIDEYAKKLKLLTTHKTITSMDKIEIEMLHAKLSVDNRMYSHRSLIIIPLTIMFSAIIGFVTLSLDELTLLSKLSFAFLALMFFFTIFYDARYISRYSYNRNYLANLLDVYLKHYDEYNPRKT